MNNYQNFTEASGFVWLFRNKSHEVVSCPFVKNFSEKFKFQFCKNNYPQSERKRERRKISRALDDWEGKAVRNVPATQ